MGRVLVFLLGLALAGLGWAIHDSGFLTTLSPGAPAIVPLGPLDVVRPIIAGASGVLGLLLVLGSVIGHRRPPQHKASRPPSPPLVFDAVDPAPFPAAKEAPLVPAEPPPEPEPFPAEIAEPVEDREPIGTVVGMAQPAPEACEPPAPAQVVAAEPPAPFPAIEAAPEVGPEPAPEPAPVIEAAPEPVVAREPPPADVAPSGPPTYGAFDLAREELRRRAREEDWRGVASVLASLPTLANSNTEHALAAQDLGVFHRSQSRREDAGEAFDQALAYARLASPPDALLLAATLTDAGDAAMEEHRLEPAITLYSELVETRRGLVAADPSPENRRLLSLALERLADAREDRGHRSRALQLYQESLGIADQLAAADPARYAAELTLTRNRVAELEARLA